MELQLQTKAQAFVLLDSFENDLRRCFRDFLLDHLAPAAFLARISLKSYQGRMATIQ